ncbi:LmeA family phospholipid-binding protein [Glaciibacter psychrotolerans]|uniref:DUF2993 domain-containing protein n=1 Tax=Glaciibacter psychrotolerans TaxID=670054 RepID=A0A7Z0J6M2_9MICO|nr:hypothetical protein [Leifsonia psychrotolerans]
MALRRRIKGFIIVGSVVVAGLVLYAVGDTVIRNYAENRIAQEIQTNLPAGVTGDVSVSIGGLSAIGQFVIGRFDEVTLDAPKISVDGATGSVHIIAQGVPTNTQKTVGHITGTVDLSQEALNTLLKNSGATPGAEVELRDGDVSYSDSLDVFGLSVGYRATATPTAAGAYLVLTPTSAEVTSTAGNLDITGLVQKILGEQPLSICVASYLPVGLDLTDVNVTPDRAQITVESTTTRLRESELTTLGTCPSS